MKKISATLKILLILGLCLMASACAGPTMCWYNTGKNLHDTKADRFKCEEAAVVYADNMGKTGDLGLIIGRVMYCMNKVNGYMLTEAGTLPQGFECVK